MSATSIEWTDYTFNPWWGCARVSAGCEHCYAETFSHRLGYEVWGPTSERRFFDDKHWKEPLRWARRRREGDARHRVFCASMADVFEDRRDLDEQRARLWQLIRDTPELTWQVLTKRPENIDKLAPGEWVTGRWPANVWLGVTAEDQERADRRIPLLLTKPASLRFVSYEPALGPVDFAGFWPVAAACGVKDAATRAALGAVARAATKLLRGGTLDWVIIGGESGPGARPFEVEWARAAVKQCRSRGVACFVKQLGARIAADGFESFPPHVLPARWDFANGRRFIPPIIGGRERMRAQPEEALTFGLCDVKGGDPDEWPEDLRIREFPA